jgi:hypothetical protein
MFVGTMAHNRHEWAPITEIHVGETLRLLAERASRLSQGIGSLTQAPFGAILQMLRAYELRPSATLAVTIFNGVAAMYGVREPLQFALNE